MRTLCDGCEAAAAQFFCAADEAALCANCDEKKKRGPIEVPLGFCRNGYAFPHAMASKLKEIVKVHSCNKLASRHIRLQLRESWSVPRCDICETAPAFLHCSIDGSSLCLQCDMDVHIGGKRTHQRYLLLGQRVELPNGLHTREENGIPKTVDTARAWQKKYCQEHLHNVAPHKTNVEPNGHLSNVGPCSKRNGEPNGTKD